ncbi:hypothetical protein ASZ78_008846 [Callipepla squamata]|uniref:Phospholipase B1, membrane-associated n=1 Tax=Callipepla squamata TaxID=9009 RepID=A0A226NEQ8_CALSU|nr:hypothetical protein ASZ78_008846 [Callipepla squamata]
MMQRVRKSLQEASTKVACPGVAEGTVAILRVHTLRPADIKVVTAIGSLQTPLGSGIHHEDLLQRGLLDQAGEIVKLMKDNQMMDFQNDWKLITVFFSAENPCSCAFTQPKNCILDNLEKLQEVLDFLYKEVPKAFVNLVDSTEITTSFLMCQDPQNASNSTGNQCNCTHERSLLNDNILRWSYQDAWEKLLKSKRYDQRDDFTVVLQPSLQETNLLLSLGRDSFFGTSKTQVETLEEDYTFMALSIWKNMMEPIGKKKPYDFTEFHQVQCPSQENPYLFTYRNSNYSLSQEISNAKETPQERSYGTNIPCFNQGPSDTVPDSVHKLRPADIKVIAALGDSITAGNGAASNPHDVLDVLTQYRGISWSVGGNENISTVTTLANILREFNPSLIGYSTGTGMQTTENAALNQAVAGAHAEDVPAQVRRLVDRMMNDSIRYSPENYTYNIQVALDMLHKEVKLFQHVILCPCVLSYDDNSTEYEQLVSFNKRYQERTRELVESGRYDTTDDFTVVMQPFLTHISMPKTQVEPVGEKTDDQQMENEIFLKCPSEAEPFLRTYKNSNYTYPNQTPSYGSQLLCEDRSPSSPSPTSVHSLKPADVKIIAALGDSLTAGTGIASYNLTDLATEYRGLSWSIGGDDSLESVTTLPNIFREFNTQIEGYSTGTGSVNDPNAFLNQAVPGAQAEHLPAQARALLGIMKTDSRIDFNADWKIITVHIGGNDLCNYCKDPVPKALVSLVGVMDILSMRQLFVDTQVQCPTYMSDYLCSCVLTGEENSENLTMVREATRAYQLSIQRLVESGRYDTHDNFTVVIQTFLQNSKIPLGQDGHPDISYFAPDCFHPNQKGHTQLAKALWNSMLQPVGQKDDSFDFVTDAVLSCPTQKNSFLGTNKNSDYTNPPVLPTNEPTENWGSDLSCSEKTPSSNVPTSVHELQPADIRVIGALGDSLTHPILVSYFIYVILFTLFRLQQEPARLTHKWSGGDVPGVQFEGSIPSWAAAAMYVNNERVAELLLPSNSVLSLCSIGGDGTLETQTTLPNILKKFSPNLFGFSTGNSTEGAGFNVAKGGATSHNMPAQARELVELMRSSSKINFKEDWKLITIFIGGNDLCQYCLDKEAYSVQNYVKHLQDALDIFYKEAEALQLVNSGRYEQREDFAVVLQPFFRNTIVPLDSNGKPDLSFFAADCFHFSEKGHAEMAIALWNNMMEPVGEKQTYNNFTYDRSKLKCPNTEKPFLSTLRNSGFRNSPLNLEKTEPSVPYWAVIVAAVAGILVGSLLLWVVSGRRARRHQHEIDAEKNMKTTSL